MAHPGSFSLDRTAIVPVAMAAAHRAKVIAIVTAVVGVTCLLLMLVGMLTNPSDPRRDVTATLLYVIVFGVFCALAALRAKRVAATATRAAADVGSTWTLVDRLVVVVDDRGQPVPECSFKVTRAQRALLLAHPAKTA